MKFTTTNLAFLLISCIPSAIAVPRKLAKSSKAAFFKLVESFDALYRSDGWVADPPAAGSDSVWIDMIWSYDPHTDGPKEAVGTARGHCTRVEPVTDGAAHCEWTLTFDNMYDTEHDKITIQGDVASTSWTTPQKLAIVGGTGYYEGASGSIVIVFRGNYWYYDVYLD